MNSVYAIVVGIDRYDQTGWTTPGPCAGALAVLDWLISFKTPVTNLFAFLEPGEGMLREEISRLRQRGVTVGERADFVTVDTFLRRNWSDRCEPNSRLLVYWSGHGFAENDRTRILACSDYTHDQFQNRVLNATLLRERLRAAPFQCFDEQIFLADVCGLYTELKFEPDRNFPTQTLSRPSPLTYFATPEGVYARSNDGIGVFTEIALSVLRQFSEWPNRKAFTQQMTEALKARDHAAFRISGLHDDGELPESLSGTVARDARSPLFNSALELLVRLDLPDDDLRPHYLETLDSMGMMDRANAQGITGMLRDLTSQGGRAEDDIPYPLVEFLVRLEAVPALHDRIRPWLEENARGRCNALANARKRLEKQSEEHILTVDIKTNATGEIETFEARLFDGNHLPARDVPPLNQSIIGGWPDFRAKLAQCLKTLEESYDASIHEIQFLVDPPLFDMPFQSIALDDEGTVLGDSYPIVLRYRKRMRSWKTPIGQTWMRYADALRPTLPSGLKLIPVNAIASEDTGVLPRQEGVCYTRFVVSFAPEAGKGNELKKKLLARVLGLGVPYLCWLSELPQDEPWNLLEGHFKEWFEQLQTLRGFPKLMLTERVRGNTFASLSAVIWDDPQFNPIELQTKIKANR